MKNRVTFIGILIILQLFISIPLTDASRQQISARKVNRYSQKHYPELNRPSHGKMNGKKKKRKKKTIKTTLEPVETTLEPIETTLEVIETTLDPPDCELKLYTEPGCNPSDFLVGLERDDGEGLVIIDGFSEDPPSSIFLNKNSETTFECYAQVGFSTSGYHNAYHMNPSEIGGSCIVLPAESLTIISISLDMSFLPP